ncbi:MAG: ATP-binding cassette domain-containing protein [Clostridiales Family XIII bacterium]|jgi:ABC-2 type transport system ATP-binding protein|nr:ATP-binding cassette domain-containing protein [Clostridiales Family XIII bacterium]
MNNLVLDLKMLTKVYAGRKVLDNVSFEVRRGGIYGFIGENGAGKTTAIRIITGLSSASSGDIEILGAKDTSGLNEARNKIGAIVESPILYKDKTAMNNMLIHGILYGVTDKEYMQHLLDKVGLGNTGRKKAKNFSLGMRQRLAIALSLISDPELLILDEPTNGLDPMGMVEVRNLLKSLNEDHGITILISSHILTELYQLATDYIIISHGRIVKQLTLEELDAEADGRSLEEYYIDLLTGSKSDVMHIENGGRRSA